jgi:disulfide bond formation protein DsbB
MINAQQRTGRFPAFALALISAATLATVYASQFIGGLVPCELCLYQRWPWWAALLLCILAMPTILSTNLRALLVGLAGLSVLAGAGIAIFHVGVEQHWWPGLASCSATGQTPASFEQMQQMLSQPAASCDEPAWTMFGISMAGYNAILSIVVGIWTVVTAAAILLGKDRGRNA